jgi:hypothetical protein
MSIKRRTPGTSSFYLQFIVVFHLSFPPYRASSLFSTSASNAWRAKIGTVIDHIPAQVGFKLLTLFKLTETDQRITIGLNLIVVFHLSFPPYRASSLFSTSASNAWRAKMPLPASSSCAPPTLKGRALT